jgi:uncharacterized protein YjbI with pentapeptide repeats
MIPIWAIGIIAGVLLVGTIVPGVRLWWPTHTDPIRRSDLGLALMTGALIAFAVLIVQLLVDVRTRQDDRNRERAAEHQSLQISLGPTNLAGIDLGDGKLANFYLRSKDLEGADLERADLTKAVLAHTRLMRANLNNAKLSNADLSWANLSGATLDGARLRKAHMYGTTLNGASLEGVDLKQAILTDAQLSADLRHARLNRAVLEGAQLPNANLMGADLRHAWLVDANFRGAFLYGADFRNTGRTLAYATLTGAVYDKTTTRWPRNYPLQGRCNGAGRCKVTASPPTETDLKTFRYVLAQQLPLGWKVEDKDPKGISVLARSGEAEFDGESLPTARPIKKPEGCIRAFKKQSSRRFRRTRPIGKPLQTAFHGRVAVARMYSFVTLNGTRGIATDVHYSRGTLCYRLEASTSPELFAIFRPDFKTLFHLLGLADSSLEPATRRRPHKKEEYQ